jgi:hypothetical protein
MISGCVSAPPQATPMPTATPAPTTHKPTPTPMPTPPKQLHVQQITIEEAPTFVCNFIDDRAKALGIGGADTGTPLVNGSQLLLIFGDIKGIVSSPTAGALPVVGSSAVIARNVSQPPSDCSSYSWLTSRGKFYEPIHSARKAGSDSSTVAQGVISVKSTNYVYATRVEYWADKSPTHLTIAHGVLFKQTAGSFTEVARWPTDQLHVNTAPVAGQLPNGTQAIFMVTSGKYRQTPVYLAYVLPQDIEAPASYSYLTGYDQKGSPVWTSDMSQAKPIPGFENVLAGGLSFLYDSPLKTYLVMFVDRSQKETPLNIYSSSNAYGPFYGPVKLYPCGTSGDRPQWMKSGWSACYGGYMLPESFGADGHDLYFTLSVWNPYTTVLMKMRINAS